VNKPIPSARFEVYTALKILLPNEDEGLISGVKAASTWSWKFTSIYCRGWGCMEVYFNSPIRLHGMVHSEVHVTSSCHGT